MNRRRFLAVAVAGVGAAGAAALAADAFAVEPRSVSFTRHSLPGRPGQAPLTFVQITDLHLRGLGALHRRIARHVNAAAPDFVVLTGDSVDDARNLGLLGSFLALLDPRIPRYAIPGNWEHWARVDLDELRDLYARHHTRLLVNETVLHEQPDAAVAITGLDDLIGGRPDLRAALRGVPPAPAHLLLAHCPDHRDRLADQARPVLIGGKVVAEGVELERYGIGAVLSGHTHGGQVRLLGWAPVLPPGSGGYVSGWYREPGAIPMYVSRGVGTTVMPVRFGCRPEVAVFRM